MYQLGLVGLFGMSNPMEINPKAAPATPNARVAADQQVLLRQGKTADRLPTAG